LAEHRLDDLGFGQQSMSQIGGEHGHPHFQSAPTVVVAIARISAAGGWQKSLQAIKAGLAVGREQRGQLHGLVVANAIRLQDLDPIPVWVFNKRQAFHFAVVGFFDELNAQRLKPLSGGIDIGYSDP